LGARLNTEHDSEEENSIMTKKKTTEIVSEIVELLTPIESDERLRVIQASATLLGENFFNNSSRAGADSANPAETAESEASTMPSRARTWMKQNGISLEEVQQIFHLENGGAEVIAGEIPGKNKKDMTYNAYVLSGLAKFLSTGVPKFDDKAARALCVSSGCYDKANHSVTIKDRGNEFTGNKKDGWELTAPGLKRAAVLIKEMTKS
jgi:hypothetical protein